MTPSIDHILAADPLAIAAAREAVTHIFAADDAGAYVCVRLAAPGILKRHPEITLGPRALSMFMLKIAADAALVLLPAPRLD